MVKGEGGGGRFIINHGKLQMVTGASGHGNVRTIMGNGPLDLIQTNKGSLLVGQQRRPKTMKA